MVKIPAWKEPVINKQVHHAHKQGVEFLAVGERMFRAGSRA